MDAVTVWSGWLGGLAIGAFLLLQLGLSGKLLGVSTGFGNLCALGSRARFFQLAPYDNPFNWRFFFLMGLPLGGALAVLSSPGASWSPSFSLGTLYDSVLPAAWWAKAPILVLGGIAIGYGARLANGCTSGHSISGMAQLNPPSFVASAGFFAGGIVAVQLLFRVFGHA